MDKKLNKQINLLGLIIFGLAITIIAFNGGFNNNLEIIDIIAGSIFGIISIILLFGLTK